ADSPVVRQFGARQTSFSRRLDPSIRIPESYQLNVGFERELGRGFVVEANYTFNRGIHLWREFNANAPRLPAGLQDFAEYLLSRDFANFRNASGARAVYNASTAGELVRFTLAPPASADTITRVVEEIGRASCRETEGDGECEQGIQEEGWGMSGVRQWTG